MSSEHFSVDGTLVGDEVPLKSFNRWRRRAWVQKPSQRAKDLWLARMISQPQLALGNEMLAEFRKT